MRKIEREIIAAMEEKREAQLSKRDKIFIALQGEAKGAMVYILWHTPLAIVGERSINLGTPGGVYRSNTTKSRINAIAGHYGLPGIVQKNFVWRWSDGRAYDGGRNFERKSI